MSSRGELTPIFTERLFAVNPVQRPKPVNTSAPTPLDRSAGSMTANSCGPPTPATSMSITAAISGFPKMTATAAAAPAAPRSAVLWAVAGARARFLKSRARPVPRAISGASGPRVAPRGRLSTAARITPGRALGETPPMCRPPAGMWPPPPGTRGTRNPTAVPATRSSGSGHHHGGRSQPSAWGRVSHITCSNSWSATRNQKATRDTGTPMRAQNTSALR